MPKRMVVDVEQLTPFARLVYEYLLSFRPSKLVSELSEETGISNQTIWDWLRKGTLPRRQTIVQLAERAKLDNGASAFDLDELLSAAGMQTTAEMQAERRQYLDTLRASIRDLEALIDVDPSFSPDDRAAIRRFLEIQPDRFIERTNTWREWNHASPAQHEAQRATDDATVYEPEPITTPEQAHGVEPSPRKRRVHRGTNPSGPYPRQQQS